MAFSVAATYISLLMRMHLVNRQTRVAVALGKWSLLLLSLLVVAGCPKPQPPDSNVEVFKPAEEVAAKRRLEQMSAWQAQAMQMIRAERPDVQATTQPLTPLEIDLAADGAKSKVKLTELADWGIPAAKKTAILRESLRPQMASFDERRLISLGFEKTKARLLPQFVPLDQSPGVYRINRAGELKWMSVVAWEGSSSPGLITPDVLATWKVPAEAVDSAAIANLKPLVKAESIEIVKFGQGQRLGDIKPGVNPAIILSPDFLPMVRSEWQISDDLVLLISSRFDVRFLGRQDRSLLTMLYPGWQQRVQQVPEVLCRSLLVLSDKGIEGIDYGAATRPATTRTTQP